MRKKNGYASLFERLGLVEAMEICGTFCTAAKVAMGPLTEDARAPTSPTTGVAPPRPSIMSCFGVEVSAAF